MRPKTKKINKELIYFYCGAILFSWCAWIPYGAAQAGVLKVFVPWELVLISQFGPSLTALFLIYRRDGKKGLQLFFQKVLKWQFHLKWYILPLLVTPLISILWIVFHYFSGDNIPSLYDFLKWPHAYAQAYGSGGPYTLQGDLVPNIGFVAFIKNLVLLNPVVASGIFILLTILTGPISEEFGWRGFMLPKLLNEYSMLKSSLILGILWGFWHTGPDFWTYVFEAKIQALLYPLAITFGTIPLSILFTWIFIKSKGSILPVLIFHASFNGTLYIITLIWENQSPLLIGAELTAGLWILSLILIYKGEFTSNKILLE